MEKRRWKRCLYRWVGLVIISSCGIIKRKTGGVNMFVLVGIIILLVLVVTFIFSMVKMIIQASKKQEERDQLQEDYYKSQLDKEGLNDKSNLR